MSDHYYRHHTLPIFTPDTFDEAMTRGRAMYGAGRQGKEYPRKGYAISTTDEASYELGKRHAREFPNG